ncbi:Polyporopepsin [Grifola frondosa]|uniref:Polyporopepsin n=1 Tax=Grifola frondosa TaxID=5627 RepID=A0A1C7MK89_GRIFR|nr:Polyporopepsin [Grifola frondosa]
MTLPIHISQCSSRHSLALLLLFIRLIPTVLSAIYPPALLAHIPYTMHTCTAFTLLSLCALSLTAKATPVVVRDSPVTLPFARRMNFTGSATLLEIDQARAKALKARSLSHEIFDKSAVIGVPATNQVVDYIVSVGVGTPPTQYDLLIDTGSSNTWLGADKRYVVTSSSHDTGEEVHVLYGSGFFIGEEYLDTVTLANGLVIKNQSIGVANITEGFDGIDGILGIGPQDLTCGTTSGGECILTVVDNAFSQDLIRQKVVGISFEPTTSVSTTNGELAFGGTDSSKFTEPLNFVPITSTSPASEFVGIDQSVTYGSAGTTILSGTAGIVDTGTTLLLLASDALERYRRATGAVLDNTTGLLKLTPVQFANLQSLFFNISGVTYELTPNAQLWPRALNAVIGGTANGVYLIVGDLGTNSGEGLDFINGMAFLERFYFVYDSESNEIDFKVASEATLFLRNVLMSSELRLYQPSNKYTIENLS